MTTARQLEDQLLLLVLTKLKSDCATIQAKIGGRPTRLFFAKYAESHWHVQDIDRSPYDLYQSTDLQDLVARIVSQWEIEEVSA